MSAGLSNESVIDWRSRGTTVRIRGIEVFYVCAGDGPDVLLLHGFPSSGYDWRAIADALVRAGRRVIVPDLPGFGLSDKPRTYSYSLVDQADVVLDLLAALDVRALDLVAHDMGTSVACELIARREEARLGVALRSLTLTNGSVFVEMAQLTPSQKILRRPIVGALFARLANRPMFMAQFRRLFGRADAVDDHELDAIWSLLKYRDGTVRLAQSIGYIAERYRRAPRWLPPLRRLTDVPTAVLWGRKDPVAVAAIAERLAATIPGAHLEWFDRLGHYPMLEDPRAFGDALLRFLEGRPDAVS